MSKTTNRYKLPVNFPKSILPATPLLPYIYQIIKFSFILPSFFQFVYKFYTRKLNQNCKNLHKHWLWCSLHFKCLAMGRGMLVVASYLFYGPDNMVIFRIYVVVIQLLRPWALWQNLYTKLSTNKSFLDAALGNLLLLKIVHHLTVVKNTSIYFYHYQNCKFNHLEGLSHMCKETKRGRPRL